MNRKSIDLVLVFALVAITVVLELAGVRSELIRLGPAIPLTLLVPGYAFSAALFPPRTLGYPERLLFSIGITIVFVVLGGLILDLTQWGLTSSTWLIFIGGLTCALLALAARRRRSIPVSRDRPMIRASSVLPIVLAVAIAGGAVAIARHGAEQQSNEGFTQLWMLSEPTAFYDQIEVGVRNQESVEMTYRLELRTGISVVSEWRKITLAPGGTWEETIVLQAPAARTGSTSIEVVLFRSDAPDTPYRRVSADLLAQLPRESGIGVLV